ncbi:hypothetical protein [Bacillus solimangrovi]|uniref:hypothetical protein n=1 Tax=Bacillus solimangrovi TaxID=1305675 RepID=UPI001586499F|nr:hypothetical protein [Bacillus solimangrovi]
MKERDNMHSNHKKRNEVRAFEDTSSELNENNDLKANQPTIQPKEIDEIEY